jgi:MFS family permease
MLQRIYTEIGLKALVSLPVDVKILCLQRFVRLLAYGSSTLILALYLSYLGNSDEKIGLFMTLKLLGDILSSLVLTIIADGIGRRRMLGLGSLLKTASGTIFCKMQQLLGVSSCKRIGRGSSEVGMGSTSTGVESADIVAAENEIGPFNTIEESTISQLIPSTDRSAILAWYTLFGTCGVVVGTIVTRGLVENLQMK